MRVTSSRKPTDGGTRTSRTGDVLRVDSRARNATPDESMNVTRCASTSIGSRARSAAAVASCSTVPRSASISPASTIRVSSGPRNTCTVPGSTTGLTNERPDGSLTSASSPGGPSASATVLLEVGDCSRCFVDEISQRRNQTNTTHNRSRSHVRRSRTPAVGNAATEWFTLIR